MISFILVLTLAEENRYLLSGRGRVGLIHSGHDEGMVLVFLDFRTLMDVDRVLKRQAIRRITGAAALGLGISVCGGVRRR